MIRQILILQLILGCFQSIYAQEGPAGMGTTDGSSSLELWLRSDVGISLIDGKVQTWSDQSGNNRDVFQNTSARRPSFKTSGINGLPTVDFVASSSSYLQGVNTANIFGISSNAPTSIGDVILVFKQPLTNSGYVVQFPRTGGNSSFLTMVNNGGNGTPADNNVLNDVQVFVRDVNSGTWSVVSSEGTANEDGFAIDNFHAIRYGFDPTLSGGNDRVWLYDINGLIQEVNTGLDIGYDGALGDQPMLIGGTASSQYYDGELAEMMVFSEALSEVKYVVIQNYLNARYNLSATNDFYAGDLVSNGAYKLGVFGIGKLASSTLSTNQKGGLTMTENSGLDNNDFLFAGYQAEVNATLDTDVLGVSGTDPARMKRVWYLDKTDASTVLTNDFVFDLDKAGLSDVTLATASNYKLIYRPGLAGTWSEVAVASAINDANNTISFQNVNTSDGYYSVATSDNSVSPIGDVQQTWYSFQSGPWGDPNTWTLDGATTPVYNNMGSEIPGSGDKVIITSGRVVDMFESDGVSILDDAIVQSLKIRNSGRLNLLTSSGHDMGVISGAGILSMQGAPNQGSPTAFVENLPDGNYSAFADQLLGGTIEINTASSGIPLILNQDLSSSITTNPNGAVSRSLRVSMANSNDRVILNRDLYLTRNLTITNGNFQIHRDNGESFTSVTLVDKTVNISVLGNVVVGSTGAITTGTANQRHQFNLYGDFTNNGSLEFTQRTAANYGAEATNGRVDLNFLNQEIDQNLVCNNTSNFYRIEVDKGSRSVALNISAAATGFFNLYGTANYQVDSNLGAGGSNLNALGLVTGVVKLGSKINVPTLGTNGNYSVSSLAGLWITGGWVRKTAGPALVVYGEFKLTAGLAEFLVQSGITLRDAGRIEISGGQLYANAIRTSIQASGDAGSYIQSGGQVYLNGGTGVGSSTTGSSSINNDYYVFTLTQPDNVFRMSNGVLEIQRSNFNSDGGTPNDATDDLGGGIFINSDPNNVEVTGGTVRMNMANGNPFKVTSKAPFYNVVMLNSSGNAIVDNNPVTTNVLPNDDGIVFLAGGQVGEAGNPDATLSAQPLVVLNDLTIGNGTNPVRFDHLGSNVTIGRNFTIALSSQYYYGNNNLLPENSPGDGVTIPSSHQNTTIFNGTISSQLALNNLNIDDDSYNEQVFYNVIINKSSSASLKVLAPNKSAVNNSSNAMRIAEGGSMRLESGILDQGSRSVRFFGDVYNADQLGVFVPGVTSVDALLKFRPVDFTIETEPGAVFGNFRLNSSNAVVTLTNDVLIKRLEYKHGRLFIGSSKVTIEELDISLNNGETNFGGCNGCLSIQDMIITNGKASDGGLSLKITGPNNPVGGMSNNINGNGILDGIDDDDFLFPIGVGTSGLNDGTSKYTPALLSISDVGDLGSDGEAYITINPVDSKLLTTDLSYESLDYYWRIRAEGFDSPPTIDQLTFFGNDVDDPSGGANLTSYVSGKVLDGGNFQRSSEINTVTDPSVPNIETTDYSITFDGSGSSFLLESSNFTAGNSNAFVGSPQIFYSRRVSSSYSITGMPQWSNGNTWSLVSHTGAAAGDWPRDGDIAILGVGTSGGGAGGPRHHVAYRSSDNYQLARVEINSNETVSSWGPRLFIEEGSTIDMGVVDGSATIEVRLDPSLPSTITGDFGAFSSRGDDGARFLFHCQAGSVVEIPEITSTYPNVRIEGGGNREVYFLNATTINNEFRVDSRATFRPRNNVTVKGNFRLGNYLDGTLLFPDDTEITIEVLGRLRVTSDNGSGVAVENDNSSVALEHQLIVHGNIELDQGSSFDLWNGNGANDDNCILTVTGSENSVLMNDDNMPVEFYRLIINKGDSPDYTFEIENNGGSEAPSLNGTSSTTEKPLEILNGTLIVSDPQVDWTIADGSDFYLPNTLNPATSSGSGALEMRNGIFRITGDDSGLLLDGSLILSGGDFDLSDCSSNGNNFIEYSATSEARIEISDPNSTLSVGSQVRRNFFSDAGILDLTITDGLLEIGTCTEGDYRRGMLEIVNDYSNFTHTGGEIIFYNQNGVTATDATVASLLLEPDDYDLSGSTITINLNETNDVNFGINSGIPLNDLNIISDTGPSSEVAQLKTRPLTVLGDLNLQNDVELRSNGLDLTLYGDLIVDDNATYSAGLNRTIFNVASAGTSQIGGSNTDEITFYDFDKTGSGTLNANKNISVTGAEFRLRTGTLADNGNTVTFTGQQMTNNSIHQSPSVDINGGVIFSATSGQQVLRTTGAGVFGNLTINNEDGVSLPDANQQLRIVNNLTLATGIFDLGPALLVFEENATVTNDLGDGDSFSDFGETNQIQTNSSIIDFGVEKEFTIGNATNFLFPVGEGNRYTPVLVDFETTGGNSGSSIGSLRVRPRNAIAPIMNTEDQSVQDAILQYHWLFNAIGFTDFSADVVAMYDDDVLGDDAESTYRGARALFSDPNLAVENPFPDSDGDMMSEPDDSDDLVDDASNQITYPIYTESDFSGEYFAGDPLVIPDQFVQLVFDGAINNLYTEPGNYFLDINDNGVFDSGTDTRQSDLMSVVGGAIEIAAGATLSLNNSGVIFSRLNITPMATLEVDNTNGHLLGQISGNGTIRILSDGSTAALPAGDYLNFFDCSTGGGTLEYGGSGNYTILIETNSISELIISGIGNKSFVSSSDITICNNLTVNGGSITLAEDRIVEVEGSLILNNGEVNLGINSNLIVNNDMDLIMGTLKGGVGGEIDLHGNLTRTATTVNLSGANTSTLNLVGSTQQSIVGNFSGSNSLGNLTINNSTSGTAILVAGGSTLTVTGVLNFIDGVILTDNTDLSAASYSISNILEFENGASWNGASGNSYVDGVVRKNDLDPSTNFTFPIGDKGVYAPMIVIEDGTGGADWVARYNRENPLNRLSNNLTDIDDTEVSVHEYWSLETASPQTASVSLVYGPQSGVVNPSETTIVSIKDNDGQSDGIDNDDTWFDIGRDGLSTGASTQGGTITSGDPSSFSVVHYTLGGQTDVALPVELISFEGELLSDGKIKLTWETATELDNDRFEIHRMTNEEFVEIGIVKGAGTTKSLMSYDFVDSNPAHGINYYRLKQVDYDGDFEYSLIISVLNNSVYQGFEAKLYPNPIENGVVQVSITSGDEVSPIRIVLLEGSGRILQDESKEPTLGKSIYQMDLNPGIESGMYFLIIQQGENKRTVRALVR